MSSTTQTESSTPFEYDFTADVAYDDDDEYRAALVRQFGVDPMEQDAGNFCFIDRLDNLFLMVKDDVHFNALRKSFEERHVIGELAMVSYDSFAAFHACLCAWHNDNENWSSSHPAFLKM